MQDVTDKLTVADTFTEIFSFWLSHPVSFFSFIVNITTKIVNVKNTKFSEISTRKKSENNLDTIIIGLGPNSRDIRKEKKNSVHPCLID